MSSNSKEILYDFSPLLIAYKDGSFKRLQPIQFVPPSVDSKTGVQSKDVLLEIFFHIKARIYLPKDADPTKKLPLVVYYHGGGFVLESAFSPLYHKYLNALVANANVVAISVNYRLAPENYISLVYEDALLGLMFVMSKEKWIKDYADLDRVYLGGDSAGGTLVHNVAMWFGLQNWTGINVRGAFLNCPYFCGNDVLEGEETEKVLSKGFLNNLWLYVSGLDGVDGCDDPRINPDKDLKLSCLGVKRVLVIVAEKDVLRVRGCFYMEVLEKSGWDGEIELVDVKGEDHDFGVFFPDSENGVAMLKKVASFLNHDD